MVLILDPELEAALNKQALQAGVAPDVLALHALRVRFMPQSLVDEPRDEWERKLRSIATDCGTALSNEAVSSEGIYD